MKRINRIFAASILGLGAISGVQAAQVKVTITNNASLGGVAITPAWVGFHNGSFDSYDSGVSADRELESLAEDGNPASLLAVFDGNRSPISTGTTPSGARVQGVLGDGPLTPGSSASAIFDLSELDNQYLSYVSMVLPSSDYFIANGNPLEHDLASLFADGNSISFNIGNNDEVNDAGTEINDFTTSAGNGLFPGLPPMQSGQNDGADENGVVHTVVNPYATFLNTPDGYDLSPFDFNSNAGYPDGIATITISVVPIPTAVWLMASGLIGLVSIARQRSNARMVL